MKNKSIVSAAAALLVLLSCRPSVSSVPTGTWEYNMIMNGTVVGDARVSVKRTSDRYITETELSVSLAGMVNRTRHTVVETSDFVPVSMEVENKTEKGSMKIDLITRVSFEGMKALIESNGKKTRVDLEKPFILEGAWFSSQLISAGFKKGHSVKAEIYDPTVEVDESIPVTMTVMGEAETEINSKSEKLIHVQHTFRNFKNIHSYHDEKGIVRKMVMVMLNNKIVLEIK